jgi:hypothetical protein
MPNAYQRTKALKVYRDGASTVVPAARLDYLKRVIISGSVTVRILDTKA